MGLGDGFIGKYNLGSHGPLDIGLDGAKGNPLAPGRIYFATDTNIMYYDEGDSWLAVGGAVGTPGLSHVLYVDGTNGNDATAISGSEGRKFKTVQAALNASQAGDIILIGPGTYTENVTIKANTTVRGLNPRQSVINGTLSFTASGPNLTDVSHLNQLGVIGNIACDFTGKTGNSSYGFLEIRDCQFPSVTCLARAGLGSDGVEVRGYSWDTLPETFDLTITNGFYDIENATVGTLTANGDAFGYVFASNVTTLAINSTGGVNFYNGVVVGPSTVAASLGSPALSIYHTTIKDVLTIGAGSTVFGVNTRFIGSGATAGAGTYNPNPLPARDGGTGLNASLATNGQLLIGNGSGFSLASLTQGAGITITNAAGGITITNSGGAGTQGLPSVLAIDSTMSTSIVPNVDNSYVIGTQTKRLSAISSGSYRFGDGATDQAVLQFEASGTINLSNPNNLAGSSARFRLYNNITGQTEALDLGFSSNQAKLVVVAGGSGVARDLLVGTAVGSSFNIITNNTNRFQISSSGVAPTFFNPANGTDQFNVGWDGSSNALLLTVQASRPLYVGSRANSNLFLRTSDTDRWIVDGGNGILYPGADNTYDFGTNANRIKDIHASGSIFNATIDGTISSNTPVIKLNQVSGKPANPTGTSSGSGVMAGIAIAFTPRGTGRVLVIVTAASSNTVQFDGSNWDLRYGTGTAPVNGAALTGTSFSTGGITGTAPQGGTSFAQVQSGMVTGLVVGTAYWFDFGQYANGGGTATFMSITYNILEV